jgi:hypothetical protein
VRRLRAIAGLVLLAATAHAQDVQVVSRQPDTVSVTIYRDLFALVTETRTVDLPEGAVTLVFEGVVDTLIPQSAVIGDTGRSVDESNYDFERLSPASLLEKSIGKEVMLSRTDEKTGNVRQVPAVVVAANTDGIVFRTREGNEALWCSGLPEMLTFDSIPGELHQTPRLSIRLAAGTAGKRQVRISYIAHGFAWSADYLAHLGAHPGAHPVDRPGADTMDLAGWITLRNLTGSSFREAEVQLVAGRLNLLDSEDDRGTSLYGSTSAYVDAEELQERRIERLEELQEELEDEIEDGPDVDLFYGCYPQGPPRPDVVDVITAEDIGKFPDSNLSESLQRVSGVELDEIVVVTGYRASMAVRENLADYQLYRLPVRTDLNARQTKQVAFLQKPAVKVDRFYGFRLGTDEEYDDLSSDIMPLSVKVGWRNVAADGLGEPLPAGLVRFFDAQTGGLFAGEARIEDSAVGTPLELTLGQSTDLTLDLRGSEDELQPGRLFWMTRNMYIPMQLRVDNAKARPVSVEIRQGKVYDELVGLRVIDANLQPSRKSGDYVWRFTVPANGSQSLSYKVGGKGDPDYY